MGKRFLVGLVAVAVTVLAVSCAKPTDATSTEPNMNAGSLVAHAGTNTVIADSTGRDSVITLIDELSATSILGKTMAYRNVDTSMSKDTTITATAPGSGSVKMHMSGSFKGTMHTPGTKYRTGNGSSSSNAIYYDYSKNGQIYWGGESKMVGTFAMTDTANGTMTVSTKTALKFNGKFEGSVLVNQLMSITTTAGRETYAMSSTYTITAGGKQFTKNVVYPATK